MLLGVLTALETLLEARRRRLGAVVGRSSALVLIAVVLMALLVARLGTGPMRVLAAACILTALALSLIRPWWTRRAVSDDRRAIHTLFAHHQPAFEAKVLRALDLTQNVQRDTGVSAELAALHLDRLLGRADVESIRRHAAVRRRQWRVVGIVALSAAALVLLLAPFRAFEGLNVLFARGGVAPLPVQWLEYPYVEAQPPAYLGQRALRLNWQSAGMLPEGTTLRVRGRPLRDGRTLVVTDGKGEVEFVDDGGGALVANWTLTQSAQLRVAARFGETLVLEPQSIQVYAQPDRVPQVIVQGAPKEVELSTLQQLELQWSAADDYQLSQIDLVLRSGGREERRTLERPALGARSATGGHLLHADDEFLERAFLPVTVRIEAKDNNSERGDVWGRSEAIVLRPASVGAPEVERHAALHALVSELVDTLAAFVEISEPAAQASDTTAAGGVSDPVKSRSQRRAAVRKGWTDIRSRLLSLNAQTQEVLDRNYAGLTMSRGMKNFVTGRLEAISKAFPVTLAGSPSEKQRNALERGVLALDAALNALANRDARDVSKSLGDVADEAAFASRQAQEGESALDEAKERLDLAISVIEQGAQNLRKLGVLGADIGSVAAADLNRVRMSRKQDDYLHAELAALHLAARLHRPNPSFGAKGGGGGGVESGDGSSGGDGSQAGGEPSDADAQFDRLARDLAELAQEHADAVDRSSSALSDAESGLGNDSLSAEAKQRADQLRRSVLRLPQPGEAPSTSRASAALSREHAGAMAHDFESMDFDGAVESGRRARSAAEEALRRGDLDEWTEQATRSALEEVSQQLQWAVQQREQWSQRKENAAREALSEVARTERELSERAQRLASEPAGDVALPQAVQERLREAEALMREATHRLESGDGQTGVQLQRQAQRLLEESDTGQTDEPAPKSNRDSDGHQGRHASFGGDVPGVDGRKAAEDFRRRVLEGLAKNGDGRLSPAVKRYAEGLLR